RHLRPTEHGIDEMHSSSVGCIPESLEQFGVVIGMTALEHESHVLCTREPALECFDQPEWVLSLDEAMEVEHEQEEKLVFREPEVGATGRSHGRVRLEGVRDAQHRL